MSDQRQDFLTRHVAAGTVPGAVLLLGGPDAEPVAAGAIATDGPPMPADAVLRIQSMGKAVWAVAALRLVEAGRIDLDDSVEPWLPELAGPQVLRRPDAALDDTTPAPGPITLRHLLTNTSGYGMQLTPTPLAAAMTANGTAAGSAAVAFGADEWLARLAELPLAFAPGEGWRYHHSFQLLGILISRLTGRSLHDHLVEDLCTPLGLLDTGMWVRAGQAHRLPAAYRWEGGSLVQTDPAGGGHYAGPPPYDVAHGELVSTAADYHRFLRALLSGALISDEHRQQMTTDQVPDRAKAPDSFFPGFWDGSGWGFGVGVTTAGEHAGRFGWAGGQGTIFRVDPDQTVGILLTQVEMGAELGPLLAEFDALR